MRYWWRRGPFTPLFIAFLKSNIKGASKFTIMAYVGTYCNSPMNSLTLDAMASTWICVLVNYFIEGWFSQTVDQYYMDSFSILITVAFVFTIFGPLFNAVLRYRCKMDSFMHALVENYMWTPMFIIFFGGLSMHISWALICYLLSIDMQWGATAKVTPQRPWLTLGIGGIKFLEGITQDHQGFQMDVCICYFRDHDDVGHCVCGAGHMADPWILSLFAAGIDVGKSLCAPARIESPVDVVFVLNWI
jgi:hypothetical protein